MVTDWPTPHAIAIDSPAAGVSFRQVDTGWAPLVSSLVPGGSPKSVSIDTVSIFRFLTVAVGSAPVRSAFIASDSP